MTVLEERMMYAVISMSEAMDEMKEAMEKQNEIMKKQTELIGRMLPEVDGEGPFVMVNRFCAGCKNFDECEDKYEPMYDCFRFEGDDE